MDPAQVEETTPCGLCGEPLIEGATGSLEPRGQCHVGCIRKARQEYFRQTGPDTYEWRERRRRKRRS